MSAKKILSVGQCGFDHSSISQVFSSRLQAQVVAAHSARDALERLKREPFALVLVNRVLDGDGSAGRDLVGQIKADPTLAEIPVMLVSNYEQSQQEAIAAGALPGFGKDNLADRDTLERVRTALERTPTAKT